MTELITAPEAARLLGVTATTVKRWVAQERLRCTTTPGGHRRFERSEIERFRRHGGGQLDDPVSRFLRQLLEGSDVYGLQSIIFEMRGRLGAWWRVADALGEALRELGNEWERGGCSVAQEHDASQRFQQAVWACAASLPSPPTERSLLAAVEGDDHTLGLSLARICLREQRWGDLWLGSPTPTSVLVEAIEQARPRMVAVSASAYSRDAARLNHHYQSVAEACLHCGAILVLGGRGAWPRTLTFGHRIWTFADFAALLSDA